MSSGMILKSESPVKLLNFYLTRQIDLEHNLIYSDGLWFVISGGGRAVLMYTFTPGWLPEITRFGLLAAAVLELSGVYFFLR